MSKFVGMTMNRDAPLDGLDDYPTPPWATRAFLESAKFVRGGSVLEPCANRGAMAEVLRKRFSRVLCMDVVDYGYPLDMIGDFTEFLGEGVADWVVTNPPFNQAEKMVEPAVRAARQGVAFLLRLQWLQGKRRYEKLFSKPALRPTHVFVMTDRIPFKEGEIATGPGAPTPMAWFVWRFYDAGSFPVIRFIPPSRNRFEGIDTDVYSA